MKIYIQTYAYKHIYTHIYIIWTFTYVFDIMTIIDDMYLHLINF